MTKSKVIFFLTKESFIRNYISANTLDILRENVDCHFLIDEKFKNHPQIIKLGKKTFFKPINYKYYDLIFEYSIWYYRQNSKSFKSRLKRTRGLSFVFLEQQSFLMKTIRIGSRILRFLKYRLQYILFANPITYPLTFWLLNSLSNKNRLLEKEIIKIDPDLVIYPTQAHESIGIDIVKICKKNHIKSIFIIDNWDNVSSKSILWEKPDRLLVWGEQTKEHAMKFQHFEADKVTPLGTSRFDQYFRLRNNNIPSHFPFKYILYFGYSLVFDESKIVKLIDEIITNNKKIFGDIKLIYRPHPSRQSRDSIRGLKLNNTIVDPQLDEWYFNLNKSKKSIQPSLEYYPSLLKNAELVVASLSSMIIESLIFKRKTLVIATKEANNPNSPHDILNNYHHFDQLSKTEGVEIIKEIKDFESILISSWKEKELIDLDILEEDCNYFCYNDEKDYSQRLYQICEAEIQEKLRVYV